MGGIYYDGANVVYDRCCQCGRQQVHNPILPHHPEEVRCVCGYAFKGIGKDGRFMLTWEPLRVFVPRTSELAGLKMSFIEALESGDEESARKYQTQYADALRLLHPRKLTLKTVR